MANAVDKTVYPCTFCGNSNFKTIRKGHSSIRQAAWYIGWKVVSRKKKIVGIICAKCVIGGKTEKDALEWYGKRG